MSRLRDILYLANEMADYSTEPLLSEAASIDLAKLDSTVTKISNRAAVILHAYMVMESGVCRHPMQAFLHAERCAGIGVKLNDDEFHALLVVWTKLWKSAERVIPADTSREASEYFTNLFMQQGE